MLESLSMLNDGVDGQNLGVIGAWQYAITPRGEIMRRKASEVATYGGWRWECSGGHVINSPASYPAELRTAIELVMVARGAK